MPTRATPAHVPESRHFVIQEHQARTHHFDFRLEKDGVLKSWAVPKGVPDVPGEKRLAIQVEDHGLGYADFEGTIPPGEYGAGEVRIWDEGSYEPRAWSDRKIDITLHGRRLDGPYTLVRFARGAPRHWLLIRNRE